MAGAFSSAFSSAFDTGGGATFQPAWALGCNSFLGEMAMQKNVAGQKIGAQLVSATDGSEFTGSVTVYVTGDAGTQAAGSVGSGACTHEGHGYHTYAPAQAETNYDLIAFTFTGSGAVPVTVQVSTRADANVTQWHGTAVVALGSETIGYAGAVLASVLANVQFIANQTVTAASGITFLASVGTAGTSTAQSGDAYAVVNSGTFGNAAIKTDTGNLVTRITSTLFGGITSLAQWLGMLAGKQTGNSTARTEIRATGAGSGTFDETTDSQEALRDRGDAAWVTATGFSTHTAADVWAVATRTLTAGTNIVLAKGVGVTGFTDLTAAQVNAEVVDALASDTYAAPPAAPLPSASLAAKINWAHALNLHIIEQTSAHQNVLSYDGSSTIGSASVTLSSDSLTLTRGRFL